MRLAKILKPGHRVAVFSKTFYLLLQQNNLQDLLGESHKKLNVIVATVLLLVEKKDKSLLSRGVCIFFPRMKNLQTKSTQWKWFWLVDLANVNKSKKWTADVS